MPNITPGLTALAIASILHAPAEAQTPRMFAVASTGDRATGLSDDAWLTAIHSAYLSETGGVSLIAGVDGFGISQVQTAAAWIAYPGEKRLATANGDWVPMSAISIRSLAEVMGLDSNDRTFVTASAASWATPSGELMPLAVEDGYVTAMSHPEVRIGSGRLGAFVEARVSEGVLIKSQYRRTDESFFRVGLFSFFDGWTQTVATEGDPARWSPQNTRVDSIFGFDIAPDGRIAAALHLSVNGQPKWVVMGGQDYWIDRTLIEVPLDVQRGPNVFRLWSTYQIALSATGHLAVLGNASVNDFQVIDRNVITVFKPDGTPSFVISPGDPVERNGVVSTLDSVPYSFFVDALGRLVFVDGAPGFTPGSVIVADTDGIRSIASEGSPAPSDPERRIERITGVSLAPRGDVAWTARVRRSADDELVDRLYLSTPEGAARQLLSTGDLAPTGNGGFGVVKSIRLLLRLELYELMARGAVTDSGYVLARAGFADGTQTLLLIDTLCPADIDRDRTLTAGDFNAFFDAYDVGDWHADLDADGEVNAGDFLHFFNVLDAGCD